MDINGKIYSIRCGWNFFWMNMENMEALQLFQTAGVIKKGNRYINHNSVSENKIENVSSGLLKLESSTVFSTQKTFLTSIDPESNIIVASEKTAVMLFLANEKINRIERSKVADPSIEILFDRAIYVVSSD